MAPSPALICVLRSGGEYGPAHVARLAAQVRAHLAGVPFRCISDVAVPCARIPMRYGWPGWWSKMELFAPENRGDGILYLDLDTSVIGSLRDLAGIDRLTMLRDFYRPKGLGSGVMYLPPDAAAVAWARWIRSPAEWQRRFRRGGDQAFLEVAFADREVTRWQDALPGQVVSYKADVRKRGLQVGTRVVAFHGRPRPWDVGW